MILTLLIIVYLVILYFLTKGPPTQRQPWTLDHA